MTGPTQSTPTPTMEQVRAQAAELLRRDRTLTEEEAFARTIVESPEAYERYVTERAAEGHVAALEK